MEPNTVTPKKASKSPLIVVLIVLIVALGAVIAYLYMKPIKTSPMVGTDTSKETTQTTQPSETQPTIPSETNASGGTTGTTVNIDKDVQSLDSLNLSGPENDYGENNLNDLTQ